MKKVLLLCLPLALLVTGHVVGSPVDGSFMGSAKIRPGLAINLVKQFKGGERTLAIVAGDGGSYLGLYVYDADGNCIAHDDHGNYQTCDKVAVEWTPATTGRYTLEVKNLGRFKDNFQIDVR
jgi:hypothetical protein